VVFARDVSEAGSYYNESSKQILSLFLVSHYDGTALSDISSMPLHLEIKIEKTDLTEEITQTTIENSEGKKPNKGSI